MALKQVSDLQLLQLMQAESSEAFQELFDRYWEPLYLFARQRLKSDADAKDRVQEIFIGLWARRARLEVHTSVAAYLHRSLQYEMLRHLSRAIKETQRQEFIATHILPDFVEGVDQLELKELEAIVADAVNRLPEKMQQVYRLHREAQLPIKEIAQRLSISEQTARNQLNAAVLKLKKGLKEALLLAILLKTIR
ncbi:MAG TPA: sigma-70 family RNA polymerase sigma factor [Chitinophaga sp.]